MKIYHVVVQDSFLVEAESKEEAIRHVKENVMLEIDRAEITAELDELGD